MSTRGARLHVHGSRSNNYTMRRSAEPSLRSLALTERRGRSAPLCQRCVYGDHSISHDPILGCTAVVGHEPTDYICNCLEGGSGS
jgi:hypothetical protein